MADQQERIVIEIDEKPAVAAATRANAAIAKGEESANRVGKAYEQAGERVVRVTDRSRSSVERLVAAVEKQAQVYGKTGVDRLIAQREQLIQRLGNEEAAVNRVRAAYDRMISAEGQQGTFGDRVRDFIQHPLESAGTAAKGFLDKLGPVGTGLAVFGVVAAGAAKQIFEFTAAAAKSAEETVNMADRTGLSIGEVERFAAEAKVAGVDVGALTSGMRKLSEALSDNSAEGEKGKRVLKSLGVDALDSNRQLRPMGQLITEIGDAISRLPNTPAQQRAISGLFGRGGAELLPLFKNFRDLRQEIERMGIGLDENGTRKLARFDDEIDKVELAWGRLKKALAKGIVATIELWKPGALGGGKLTAEQMQRSGMGYYRPEENLTAPAPVGPGYADTVTTGAAGRNRDLLWERMLQGNRELSTRLQLTKAEAETKEAFQEKDAAAYQTASANVERLKKQLELIEKAKEATKKFTEEQKALNKQVTAFYTSMFSANAGLKTGAFGRGEGPGDLESLQYMSGENAVSFGVRDLLLGRFGTGDQRQAASAARLTADAQEWNREWEENRKRELAHAERMIELRASPGGELSAARQIYELRNAAAKTEAERAEAAMTYEERTLEIQRRKFDSLKSSAEGIFDALLTRSSSVFGAIGNLFKTAILTPIKEAFSTWIAGMMMPMFGGRGAGGATGGGAFSLASILGAGNGFGISGWGGSTAPTSALGAGGIGWGARLPGDTFSSPGGSGFNSAALYQMGALSAIMGGGSLALGGIRSGSGSRTMIGTTMAGAGVGYLVGGAAGGVGGGLLGLGAGLYINGLQRGGGWGVAESTAGGALAGLMIGGPIGAAIGAGVGLVSGIIRLFIKGASEKLRDKILATYGVRMEDKGMLAQILETAKSSFGGNLDVAIRSPQIRDLIELYAMATGQRFAYQGQGPQTALSLAQSGGSLYQSSGYLNGSPMPSLGGIPALGGGVSAGAMQNAGPVVIPLNIDGRAVGTAVLQNGRVVTQGAIQGMKASAGRREMSTLNMRPGLVTA